MAGRYRPAIRLPTVQTPERTLRHNGARTARTRDETTRTNGWHFSASLPLCPRSNGAPCIRRRNSRETEKVYRIVVAGALVPERTTLGHLAPYQEDPARCGTCALADSAGADRRTRKITDARTVQAASSDDGARCRPVCIPGSARAAAEAGDTIGGRSSLCSQPGDD